MHFMQLSIPQYVGRPVLAPHRATRSAFANVKASTSGKSDRSSPTSILTSDLASDTSVDPAPDPAQLVADRTPPAASEFSIPVSHPLVFVANLAIYSMISIDVFSPDSLHLLQPFDEAVHQSALSNLSPGFWQQVFGNVFSNWWTMAGSVGWIFTTATALACALGWSLWIFGVGPIEHDPLLMEVLKGSFSRPRPSPLRCTPSFPSGHTAAVVLVIGALLFVLLPVVYGSRPGGGGGGGGRNGAAAEAAGGDGNGGAGSHPVLEFIYSVQGSWGLWALSAVTTAVGRLGVDAHWLSDTLAGGALSAALVSGLANATERLACDDAGRRSGR
ncbi:hypothetical protein Vretimale_14112 [Volvox reticuliferus]|nr:hypothetical protein Vretimale_14112 [Volvox reticuliferus]